MDCCDGLDDSSAKDFKFDVNNDFTEQTCKYSM